MVVADPATGHKKLDIVAKLYYRTAINRLKDGDKVTVIVEQRKWKRTLAQNSYYWGVYLPLIASETGESDLDRLHTLFKGKFLTKGVFDVLGEKVRVTGSTADLSVGEFCEYILGIENLTQVSAPPTENYDLAPLHGDPVIHN